MLDYKEHKLLMVGSIGTVILVIGCVIFQSAIDRRLYDWKLLPEPQRLTELYFNNSAHLPATYVTGTTQVFSFTVHNLEYNNMTYNYSVSSRSSNYTTTDLVSGSFYLRANLYKDIRINLTMPDLGPRGQILVSLSSPKESIDYWVSEGAQ
jgi:hypothetical protein